MAPMAGTLALESPHRGAPPILLVLGYGQRQDFSATRFRVGLESPVPQRGLGTRRVY